MIINHGRELPKGAVPCQEEADPVTGHFPHWLLCKENNKQFDDKWYLDALKEKSEWEDGTYELIGPHFSSNVYNLEKDKLVKHGEHILDGVPFDYDGIKKYLHDNLIEGIVFYDEDGHMCKIKRSDFNYKWNTKGYIQTHTQKNNLIISVGKEYIKEQLNNYSHICNDKSTLNVDSTYTALKCLTEYILELETKCGINNYVFIKDNSVFDIK